MQCYRNLANKQFLISMSVLSLELSILILLIMLTGLEECEIDRVDCYRRLYR